MDFSQEEEIINKVVTDYRETIKSLVADTVNSALISIILIRKIGYEVPAPHQSYFSEMDGATRIFSRVDEFLLSARNEDFVFSGSMWHHKISAS